MKFIQYRIGDKVQLKKKHPCGSQEWEVLELGSDMRIRCAGCGHITMIERPKFIKNTKKILNRDMNGKLDIIARQDDSFD